MISVGDNWGEVLQRSGCRLTAQRRTVVEIIAETTCALTPVELYDQALKQCPGLGLVSVYRTLEKLEQLGLVQRVHQAKNCQAFIRAGAGHQHLLLCSRCGRVVLFDGDHLEPLFTTISNDTGFLIQNHWLQVEGLCKECQSDGQVQI